MDQSTKKGTHMPGRHAVVNSKMKVGQGAQLPKDSYVHETLTAARKAQKPGQSIVRMADHIVVSVK